MGPTPYDIAENLLRKAQEYADRMSVQRNKDLGGIKRCIRSAELRVEEATEYRDAVRGVLQKEDVELGKIFPEELEEEFGFDAKTQSAGKPSDVGVTKPYIDPKSHTETSVGQPEFYHSRSNYDLREPIASVLLFSTLLAIGAYNKWRGRKI